MKHRIRCRAFSLVFLWFLVALDQYACAKYKYDTSINIFSPNGDLNQVQYAEKACQKGEQTVALIPNGQDIIICNPAKKDGVLLDRRSVDKIIQIDDSIWGSFSGLAGDGLALTREAREYCSSFRIQYGCAPSLQAVANSIGRYQHAKTVSGSSRPMGASLLLFGFDEDNTPHVYLSQPSGLISEWRAVAIGKGNEANMAKLESLLGSDFGKSGLAISACANVLTSILSDASSIDNAEEEELDTVQNAAEKLTGGIDVYAFVQKRRGVSSKVGYKMLANVRKTETLRHWLAETISDGKADNDH
jgi:20S proteasome alpha/beta subunit